jgi:hypothetical protein
LLPAAFLLPFVEPVSWHQASPVAEDSRNVGLDATVSARALIRRLPMAGSSAQAGTRPQRTCTSSRCLVSGFARRIRMIGTG